MVARPSRIKKCVKNKNEEILSHFLIPFISIKIVERYSISFFGFDVLVGSDNIGTPKSLGPLQTTSLLSLSLNISPSPNQGAFCSWVALLRNSKIGKEKMGGYKKNPPSHLLEILSIIPFFP
jgi:hypothetical protein